MAQESYWEQRGQTIGAIAIGATATSPSITRTTSTKITSITSIEGAIGLILIVASKAENGSTMHSIAAALLTEIETRLISTAAALDSSRPAELIAPAVRQVSAVERVLPEEQATDPVAEELETSDPAIVPGADAELQAVRAI